MRVTIIGTGYVGTVAGACFAETGNEVICADVDPRKVEALSDGDPVIYEPGLEDLLRRNLRHGRIRFTTSIEDAVAEGGVVFMTVGTPSRSDGSADLSFLEAAARQVGRAIRKHVVVVNKSTVPVGTHRKVEEWIRQETSVPFDVVSNPEFLREGSAVRDFLYPERVVIGTRRASVFTVMSHLYSPFVNDPARILRMDPVSAELTKYACNAFLATRISFMNEISRLCDLVGGDVESLRSGMALDSRIGPYFLNAGMGYGGSCFPKDIRALVSTARESGLELRIVQATEEVNAEQKTVLMDAIRERFGAKLKGRRFAVWGVAFKPETDDIREAPAIELVSALIEAGAKVNGYDPVVKQDALAKLASTGKFEMNDDPYEALTSADALIVATEWRPFREPDFGRMQSLMRHPVIFDGRNCIDPRAAQAEGFYYRGIGRSGAVANENVTLLPVSVVADLTAGRKKPSVDRTRRQSGGASLGRTAARR